jgi:hypothetical protein
MEWERNINGILEFDVKQARSCASHGNHQLRLRLLLPEFNPLRCIGGGGGEGAAGEAFAAARAMDNRMLLPPLVVLNGGLDERPLWRLSVRRTA